METKNLKPIVSALNKVYAKNTVLPVVENVMIKDQFIEITDLEVTLRILLPDKSFGDGILLPFSEMKNLVSSFDEVNVLSQYAGSVRYIADGAEVQISTDEIGDFPASPDLSNATNIVELDKEDVANLISARKYVSKDMLRFAMQQVALKDAHILSTNGHLAFFSPTAHKFEGTCLISTKAVDIIGVLGGVWNIGQTDRYLILTNSIGTAQIIYRKIDESYPNVLSVVPSENPIEFTANVKDLEKIVTQAIKFSNATTSRIGVRVGDGITVFAEDLDFGKSYNKTLDGPTSQRGEIEIGFNGKFLLSVLKEVTSKTVNIKMSMPSSAAIINENIILMPLMIK